MNYRICYRYRPDTGEYAGESPAFSDPLIHGRYALPSNCTFEIPPELTEDCTIQIFDGEKWYIEKDYRKKIVDGVMKEGRPFYDPKDFFWALPQYMKVPGDIPAGMVWEKEAEPSEKSEIKELKNTIREARGYLERTDYIHNVIAEEPEKAGKYEEIIQERKRIRATIDPSEELLENLKSELVERYGEEVLDHLD